MAAYRILIIERNQRIGSLVAGQLQERGYEAFVVCNGAEAALKLRETLADLILIDHLVPMGGVKTVRLLRFNAKYHQIPVIVTLPLNKEEARRIIMEGQQAGVGHYLVKPFTLASLQKKIEEITRETRSVEQPNYLQVREEIRSLTNLPVMPEARSKLLLLLSRPNDEVDINQVSRTLELDPALSTQVMRVCRSAYFGFQGSLMKQAVAFLGIDEIRKVVQSAVIYRMFDETQGIGNRFPLNDLWRHSLATGMGMEILGKVDKKKTHFLLGVLHDIGKAVFMVRFPDHFSAVLDLVEKEQCFIFQAEQEVLGITHADCGGELASLWGLPGEIRTAIASHHAPAQTSQHRRLAAMVHISDIAVRIMKIGNPGDSLIPPMDPYAARVHKNMDEILAQQEKITAQVEAIM